MIHSFYERLISVFQNSPKPFFSYYGEKHTFREAYQNIKKLNYYLGPYKGKKVVLYGEKSFDVYCAIYSILFSGNIWVPFSPGIPAERLQSMLDVLMPDIIVFEGALPAELLEFGQRQDIVFIKLEDVVAGDKTSDVFNTVFLIRMIWLM